MAFDEVRLAAADKPAVAVYLLEAMHLLAEAGLAAGLAHLPPPVKEQADLVLASLERQTGLPAPDVERVRAAHAARFGID